MAEVKDKLHIMRHSLAHIMAAAIFELWPKTKFGVGPVVEDGFYYDVDPGISISEADLLKIETKMQEIIKANLPFEKSELPIEQAIIWAKDNNQDFKLELLNDLKRAGTTEIKDLETEQLGLSADESKVANVTFYKTGKFMDLCRGPHVVSTATVGAFKLHKVAGAYWRGDETKPQLQRVYGWAFNTRDELELYIKSMEEAKERDHRKHGKELDLFTFSDLVGSGLPMFTPRGTWLRELLGRYSQQLRYSRGFERVWTPHITKHDLYKTSGHWDKFGDELFLVKSQESSDEFAMKPMNCPHHIQIYNSKPRSYRDLPIKYMENATVYRDEKSGELHGLSRARAFTQDDSHVFCTQEQIPQVITELVQAAKEMYQVLDMKLKFRLSFRDDSDAYLGDPKFWQSAETELEKLSKANGLDYYVETGEAAFYGPKIDYIAVDSLNREWQVATVQLDMVMPGRFGITYTNETGEERTPVMVHCALLGSLERFLSVYIEHVNGHFPFWLAPEQVRILTINDTVTDYVNQVRSILDGVVLNSPLKYNDLRYAVDDRNESLGKKIKEAQIAKIPAMLIIGPRDKEASTVSFRIGNKEETVNLDKLGEYLKSV